MSYYCIIQNILTLEKRKIVSLGSMPVELISRDAYYEKLNLQFEDSWILENDSIQFPSKYFEEDYHETMDLQLFVIQILKEHGYQIQEYTFVDISDHKKNYETDIIKYIEPVKKVFLWITDQHLKIISEIWVHLVEFHQMELYKCFEKDNRFEYLVNGLISIFASTESKKFYSEWTMSHNSDLFHDIVTELFSYLASYGTNYATICLFLYENYILVKKGTITNNYRFLTGCVNRIKKEISMMCIFDNHDLNMCMLAVYKSICITFGAQPYLEKVKDIDFNSLEIKGVVNNMAGSSLFSEIKIRWCIYQCHYIFTNGYKAWSIKIGQTKPTLVNLVSESPNVVLLSLGFYNEENLKSLPFWMIEYC
jgi:hypothetical protein